MIQSCAEGDVLLMAVLFCFLFNIHELSSEMYLFPNKQGIECITIKCITMNCF